MAGNGLPEGFILDESPVASELPAGFKLDQDATEDESLVKSYLANEDKYGTVGQQALTALEGAASSATFGLSTGLETSLGVDPEDIKKRRETNPIVHSGRIIPLAPWKKKLMKRAGSSRLLLEREKLRSERGVPACSYDYAGQRPPPVM